MRILVMACAVAALVALSARTEARPPVLNMLQAPSSSATGVQAGLASWYGPECKGNLTASGALFNENALTCAHRKLPLGTKVKVTNLLNNRSLVLRVNDRGPRDPGRVLDVSKLAAKQLGFLQAGLAPVQIQILTYPHGNSGISPAASPVVANSASSNSK